MNKQERINEIEVAAKLEDAMTDLTGHHAQLNNLNSELCKISHNIVRVIGRINEAHAQLVTGGESE